jgi:hypothetical protein
MVLPLSIFAILICGVFMVQSSDRKTGCARPVDFQTAPLPIYGVASSSVWWLGMGSFIPNHGQPAPYPSLAVRARNGRFADNPEVNYEMRAFHY